MSLNSEQQYGDQTKNKQKKLAITHNIDAVESGVETPEITRPTVQSKLTCTYSTNAMGL